MQIIHAEGPRGLALISASVPCVHAGLFVSGRPNANPPASAGADRPHDGTLRAAFVKSSLASVFLAG